MKNINPAIVIVAVVAAILIFSSSSCSIDSDIGVRTRDAPAGPGVTDGSNPRWYRDLDWDRR